MRRFERKYRRLTTGMPIIICTAGLVAEEDGKVLGWVAISPFSSIPAYQGVAEVSLYIDEDARGKGIGTALMHAVIEASEAAGHLDVAFANLSGKHGEFEASPTVWFPGSRPAGTDRTIGRRLAGYDFTGAQKSDLKRSELYEKGRWMLVSASPLCLKN